MHAKAFATHCTMWFSCKCVFFTHSIEAVVCWKLKSLEIRPKDSHNNNQKNVWGISDFHNLSITMASDVTHIITVKFWWTNLTEKPERKQQ